MKRIAGCAVFVSLSLCLITSVQGTQMFRRGDVNGDGTHDLSDAVAALGALFMGRETPPCEDTMDVNNDGATDLSDSVYLLQHLFLGKAAPPPPFPECGVEFDAVPDTIPCASYPSCAQCLGQTDLDQIIAEEFSPVVCIAAGSIETSIEVPLIGTIVIRVCPLEGAGLCGTEAGCSIVLENLSGTLDTTNKELRVHIEGRAEDLPITLNTTTCTTDINFAGDAVVTYTTTPNGDGTYTIATVSDPVIENADVSMTATGGLLCDILESQQALFEEELIAQLETTAQELMAELRLQVEGQVLCPTQ